MVSLELSVEELRSRAEILRRSKKVSMHGILRLFGVSLPECQDSVQAEVGEMEEDVEGMEEYIVRLIKSLEAEAEDKAAWQAEMEAKRAFRALNRKSRPRSASSQRNSQSVATRAMRV